MLHPRVVALRCTWKRCVRHLKSRLVVHADVQPTHMGSGAIHAQQTATEKHWGQMGQPSGSSGYGRGHGEQGFNIKGDGTDVIGGDTRGVARLTPTETARAVARSRNMPIFNSRASCADRGETFSHANQLFRLQATSALAVNATHFWNLLCVLDVFAGWNANPFDQSVESSRYNILPDYMWDHLLRGAADCVKGCNDGTGGCMAPSF